MSLLRRPAEGAGNGKRKRPVGGASGASGSLESFFQLQPSQAQPSQATPKPAVAAAAAASVSSALWVDSHEPRLSAQLAVHKKKVEEVRHWLEKTDASLQLGLPPTPRMLVVSGPPGSGKSATLRVLARELGFELCEWVEARSQRWQAPDADADANAPPYESRLSQFSSFLTASMRTLSLALTPAAVTPAAGAAAGAAAAGLRKRLVLLEDLPVSGGSYEGGGSMHAELQKRQCAVLR